MNYSSFCSSLTARLSKNLPAGTCIRSQKIQKNNGILLDALCFFTPGTGYSPLVYLSPLYEDFQNGCPLEEIIAEILAGIKKEPPFSSGFLKKMRDFPSVRDRIAFRLISRDANRELLKDLPWVPFLDLAMVFYLVLDSCPESQTTALIRTEQLSLWNLSIGALYCLALENTPLLFPPSLVPLEELLFGHVPSQPAAPNSSPAPGSAPLLYVLTNTAGIHGASCLLYGDLLKNFADQAGADLLVLPSSIHEVLLIPDLHMYSYGEIRDMVRTVNAEDVPAEDRLSDELYLYRREQALLTIWLSGGPQNTPEPDERWNP